MQHFGVRTRLLDWTESILVALYFAVERSPDCPGEIWCIRPDALNNRSNLYLSSLDRPQIHYLAAEAFSNENDVAKLKTFARDLSISEIPKNPIAFLPPDRGVTPWPAGDHSLRSSCRLQDFAFTVSDRVGHHCGDVVS